MKLFRVSLAVQPSPDHPLYWELQSGLLQIWLYAAAPGDARERAVAVARQLPYELLEAPPATIHEDTLGVHQQFAQPEAAARQLGLALFLIASPTGTDLL